MSVQSVSGLIPHIGGWFMLALFSAGLLAASWIDTRTRLIPNRLTYSLVLLGLISNGLMTLLGCDGTTGVVGIGESLQGVIACFSLMLLLFLSNATGGGDVKLATAIGAFLGPQAGMMSIAWCHLLAGVVALLWLISRLDFRRLILNTRHYLWACAMTGKPLRIQSAASLGQMRIPMAAFFTLGVLVTQLGYRLW